jgi:RNA polymerase-interacting CarD/CdnL/TRCF family regulator
MANSSQWRELYKAASAELAPAKKLELCLQCRQLIQEEMTERESDRDRDMLEEALRSLWIMEQEIRNPKIH